LHTTDGGKTWVVQKRDPKAYYSGVWGSGKDDVYVAGYSRDILHTSNSGKTWTRQKPRVECGVGSIWGSGPDNLFAVGGYEGTRGGSNEGVILHSSDRGKTWLPQHADGDPEGDEGSGTSPLNLVWGLDPRIVFAVGEDDLARTSDGGKTWVSDSPNT